VLLSAKEYVMDNTRRGWPLGLLIALGAGVGAAMGAATDNMGVWVALGVAIATAIGVPLYNARNR
jgi:hypothetical protein